MTCLLLTFVLAILPGSHHSAAITDTATRNMTIPIEYSFSGITIYNDIRVYIVEGTKNEIIISNEVFGGNFKFKVDNDVLIIKNKKNIFGGNNNMIKIIIKVKDIHSITIMDDAEVRTIGELSDRNLKLEIFGDGAIYASTKANEVKTFIKGLGKIEVKGNFKNTSINRDANGNMVTTYN